MKFCLEINYDLFFLDILSRLAPKVIFLRKSQVKSSKSQVMTWLFWKSYQGFRRGQSRKSGDFDQNTKSGLKSSFLGFINRQTAQNGGNWFLYMILRWKNFYGLNPFGHSRPFRYGHLGIFCGDGPRQIIFKITFLLSTQLGLSIGAWIAIPWLE
jgi:hypothetical protein